MSRSFAFLAAVALAASPSAAIVIRHDIPDAAYLSQESAFPALFGIYRTKQGHKECIATLIAPQWAVTAAHCTHEKKLIEATKPGGSGFGVEINGQQATIDRLARHPSTGSSRAPDIALLHLAAPVAGVAPVPLYRRQDERGRIVLMPGWGGTGNGQTGLGPEDGLFRIAENVVEQTEPGKIWWRFDAPGPNTHALTLEGISGPGDSGGPALIRTPAGFAIAGVSSAQDTKDGPEGLYGVDEVFVRISSVAGWIDATIADGQRSGCRRRKGGKSGC